MSLFGCLAWLELRQQLRSHVFWIVFAVSLLMVLGAAAIDALRLDAAASLGSGGGLIVRVHLIWTLFYLFTAAAFVADAVIRDDQTRFAPLVRATPVPQRTYIFARFAGSLGALCLCFLSVPAALLAAPLLPGADPAWSPPFLPGTYLLALGLLALPNLFVSAALFFALATATRSLTGCFLGAVALLTLYGIQQESSGTADTVLQLAEPFGFAASAQLIGGSGGSWAPLVANRLLWLALALLLLWLGQRVYLRRPAGSARAEAKPAPEPLSRPLPPLSLPHFGPATLLAQLKLRVVHELRQTMLTFPFAVLLLLGAAGAAANLWPQVQAGAATNTLLRVLIQSFQLVPAVVALFFAGELVWSEQAHRMSGIVRAAPAPAALLLLAKFIALATLLATLAMAAAATLGALQLTAGQVPQPATLLFAYVLPKSYDWILFGVLAMVLQVLAPNKLAGWGLLVLFMIAGLGLDQAGLDDPGYRYASYPGAPLPPPLSGATGATGYRLMWGAIALAMLAGALLTAERRRRG